MRELLTRSQLRIVIQGDNAFYSPIDLLARRKLKVSRSSVLALPRFLDHEVSLDEVNKTGLGSSAALVTSIVGALMGHLDLLNQDPTHDELTRVHHIAQFVHCLAQGKIGSGFDISSAVWGSQIYRRFSYSVLERPLAKAVCDSRL